MHENHNPFLFLIEINNMHRTRHILPIPRTCFWRRCRRCCLLKKRNSRNPLTYYEIHLSIAKTN